MSLRWVKSRKRYEKKNLNFDPETCVGYSYNWYAIVKKIDGKIVLNTYPYSRTTSRHVHLIRNLLTRLNLKVDVEVCAPRGLDNHGSVLGYYRSEIAKQKEKINAKGSWKSKNDERRLIISYFEKELNRYLACYNGKIIEEEIKYLLESAS